MKYGKSPRTITADLIHSAAVADLADASSCSRTKRRYKNSNGVIIIIIIIIIIISIVVAETYYYY